MWIQIKQKSLFYINEKQNNPIPVTLPQTANSITEDNEGNIWISTTDNIYMLEQKNNFQHPRSVIPTQTSHKEKITNIRGIQSDSKGNIWAGYRNGLILIKKTKLDKFEIKIYNKFNLKNSQININNLYFERVLTTYGLAPEILDYLCLNLMSKVTLLIKHDFTYRIIITNR